MITLVVSLALLNLVLAFLYLRVVIRASRALREIYEVTDRGRALLTVLAPWRAIEAMKEDLKIKNAALKLADDLGIDVDGLIGVVSSQENEA